jgi:hypothetical protein
MRALGVGRVIGVIGMRRLRLGRQSGLCRISLMSVALAATLAVLLNAGARIVHCAGNAPPKPHGGECNRRAYEPEQDRVFGRGNPAIVS